MKTVILFWNALLNEILKTKNAYLFVISLAVAFFIPAIYFVHYIIDYERVIPKPGVNPWGKFFFSQFSMTPLLYSLFVIVVTSYLVQMEHKSSALKMIFAMPMPKWALYFSKQVVILCVVFVTYLIFFGLILCSGYLLSAINAEYAFHLYKPDFKLMSKVFLSSFATVFGVIALQYWISFKIKNFLIPLGIGLIMVIIGIIIFRSSRFAPFFLYGYNISNLTAINPANPNTFEWLSSFSVYSLWYFLVIGIVGYFNVSKSAVK
ncbi:MAG: ABC transporter permease [Bacteroidetes bacterium]|nr:ABC transporter permease [Bacteroidota bacterium]